MSVITFTTDWNNNDYYLGAIKGYFHSQLPEIFIVEISHQISLFSSAQAAFILRQTYRFYPEGSIHIIGVNSESSQDSAHVAVYSNGHYFIGADNGVMGFILDGVADYVVQLTNNQHLSFPEMFFSEVACQIVKNKSLDNIGMKIDGIKRSFPLSATLDESVINGSIIYIDSYKNAITNITRHDFENIGKGRDFTIFVSSNHHKIIKINKQYNETAGGELLALFNSSGLLEIAISYGQVCDILNLKMNSTIRVKFQDRQVIEELKLM